MLYGGQINKINRFYLSKSQTAWVVWFFL